MFHDGLNDTAAIASSSKSAPNGPSIQQVDSPVKTTNFQNGPAMFEHEDWTLFRLIATLPQKAGVPLAELPRLICKELADNALDASGGCRVGLLGSNGFFGDGRSAQGRGSRR